MKKLEMIFVMPKGVTGTVPSEHLAAIAAGYENRRDVPSEMRGRVTDIFVGPECELPAYVAGALRPERTVIAVTDGRKTLNYVYPKGDKLRRMLLDAALTGNKTSYDVLLEYRDLMNMKGSVL